MKARNYMKAALLGASASVAVIALSIGSASAGEFDGVTLRVGTWGGSWRKVQEDYIVPSLPLKA